MFPISRATKLTTICLRMFVVASSIALSACASHKEMTAPCKRPSSVVAGENAYAAQAQTIQTPAQLSLNRLVDTACGPLYPINTELTTDLKNNAPDISQ